MVSIFYELCKCGLILIVFFIVTAASFTATSSYQTVDNSNSYISNVIPDSTGDTQGFNYQYSNQFYNQYNNQYNNQYHNQYNNQYQYQYQQPETYYQPETTSFRPLLSIFKTASNLFNKPKPQVRIGTVFI